MQENTNKSLKVLCSAEAFGYGPCSKLVSVVKQIKNDLPEFRADFIGDGSSLDFALQNDSLFNNVWEYNGSYPDARNYDLVVSVMNPYLALWGWFYRKRVIYIDSLFWFWKFQDEKYEFLQETIDELTSARSLSEVWALVKNVTDHHLHYLAHKVSNLSCVQSFAEHLPKQDSFRESIPNIVHVDPIVDLSLKKEVDRDTILISLGGLLSPLNQKKEALAYVELVLKITTPFIIEASKKYKVILATNPEITKLIKNAPQGLIVTSLSHEETLKLINRSLLVLTPAGLTTLFECLLYQTPIFILPELHDGHYPNYLGLAKRCTPQEELENIFPHTLITPRITGSPQEENPNDELRRIQSLIKKLNVMNDSTVREMERSVSAFVTKIDDSSQLRDMASKQYSSVFSAGRRENSKDIYGVIHNQINNDGQPPSIRRRHTVGVISSAVLFDEDSEEAREIVWLGTQLAKYGINVVTGAAIGISHSIGKAAQSAGSKLIGFSPASNIVMHSKKEDNAPASEFDNIHFNERGFTARSLEFIKSVDALIMVSGRMGTLSEFTIAFEEGVPIFVLQGYGGISDKIGQIISFAKKDGNITPCICNGPKMLVSQLLQNLESNYYTQ